MKETESFEVVHLLFESWPAKSIPTSDGSRALMNLIHALYPINTRPQQSAYDEDWSGDTSRHIDPPIVVHCSEGGRTGTFIALNSLLRKYKCISSPYDDTHTAPHIPPSPLGPPSSAIFNDPALREIDHIRDQRAAMVDSEAQVCPSKYNMQCVTVLQCLSGLLNVIAYVIGSIHLSNVVGRYYRKESTTRHRPLYTDHS